MGGGVAFLRRRGAGNRRRPAAILDNGPRGLVTELVGRVIGARLRKRVVPDTSHLDAHRPGAVGAQVPLGERHLTHVLGSLWESDWQPLRKEQPMPTDLVVLDPWLASTIPA